MSALSLARTLTLSSWSRIARYLCAGALGATYACGGHETVAPATPQTVETQASGTPAAASTGGLVNLIQNPSFEAARVRSVAPFWTRMFWGAPAPTFLYPTTGRSGSGAGVSLATVSSGDARWQHHPVSVTPGATYTYSVWYRSSASTALTVVYTDDNGQLTYAGLAQVPSSGGVWRQLWQTFVVPAGQRKASVFHLLRDAGTLIIDDVVLVEGVLSRPPAPSVSLSATPTSIVVGEAVALTWNATNAVSCTSSGAWLGTRLTSGTLYVAPNASTTYSLTCDGVGGSTTSSVSVEVNDAPPADAFAEGMVTFSFDDSWESQYVNALPMLEAAGFKATFFLTTDFVEQGFALFMSPLNLRDIKNRGHEVAGHTLSHPSLTDISAAAVRTEVEASRAYLYFLTGAPVNSFAYPFGNVNASVKAIVRDAGYTSARGIRGSALNTPSVDPFDLYSDCLTTETTLAQVAARIAEAKANRQWYIMCLHDVLLFGGDNLTVRPQRFQEIVNAVRTAGVRVVTIEEGRALLRN
ncbi:MAG: polysaccharide deacetylase family protein [Gemmatimonadaceae bacterium]|nr:polysaccharide deacetylase family protein [Gemmatimonadaceae bacterium]